MGAHHHEPDPTRQRNRRRLAIVLGLTATFVVVEVIGALLTGSLALLADAGHMLSDTVALAVALVAIWLAQRPVTAERTFGYKRAEILAALANGVALVAISIWILIEAGRRLGDPPEVVGGGMLAVALAGLAVNAAGVAILWRGRTESINMRAALWHVSADLLGSLGVIVAAIVILTTGWLYADPLIGALIAALILLSAWGILRDSVRILLEAAPPGIDARRVGELIASAEGVVSVHDLHIWTITSDFPALAAHVLVGPEEDCHRRRRELDALLREEVGIEHVTLQVEHTDEPQLLQIEDAGEAGRSPAGERRRG